MDNAILRGDPLMYTYDLHIRFSPLDVQRIGLCPLATHPNTWTLYFVPSKILYIAPLP